MESVGFHHVPIMVREVTDLLLPARGGVFVDGFGTFEMSGGSITNNVLSSYSSFGFMSLASGGGVYVNGGSFTMTGGEISGNAAEFGGGGVCVCWGTFTMAGGMISGNSADYGGGVDVY